MENYKTSGTISAKCYKPVFLKLLPDWLCVSIFLYKIMTIIYCISLIVSHDSFSRIVLGILYVIFAFICFPVEKRIEFKIWEMRLKKEKNIVEFVISSYFTEDGIFVTSKTVNKTNFFHQYSDFLKYVKTDKALFLITRDLKTVVPVFYGMLSDNESMELTKLLKEKGIRFSNILI